MLMLVEMDTQFNLPINNAQGLSAERVLTKTLFLVPMVGAVSYFSPINYSS